MEQFGQARVHPDQPELVDDQDVLWGAGELEKHPRADQLDAHRVFMSRPVTELHEPAEGPLTMQGCRPVEVADGAASAASRLDQVRVR